MPASQGLAVPQQRGSLAPLGYETKDRKIVVVEEEVNRLRLPSSKYRRKMVRTRKNG
jgi:hypothetical protein